MYFSCCWCRWWCVSVFFALLGVFVCECEVVKFSKQSEYPVIEVFKYICARAHTRASMYIFLIGTAVKGCTYEQNKHFQYGKKITYTNKQMKATEQPGEWERKKWIITSAGAFIQFSRLFVRSLIHSLRSKSLSALFLWNCKNLIASTHYTHAHAYSICINAMFAELILI